MVELTPEIIDVMKKVKDALMDSSFEINRFEVGRSGAGGDVLNIDIRKHDVVYTEGVKDE